MASSYPGQIPSYPTHVDFTEYMTAADLNTVQTDIVAIATTLGAGSGSVAANPLYSVSYNQTFATVTARIANVESHASSAITIDGAAADISASAPSDTKAAGAIGKAADAGHRHSREAFGSAGQITSSNVADTGLAGSTGAVADAGHKHAREGWTAVTPSAVAQAGAVGTSTSGETRPDHAHQGVASVSGGSGVSVTGGDGSGHGALTIAYNGTKTIRLPYTFSVSGLIAVPAGASNYLPPFFFPIPAGQSATLQAVRCMIRSGTSVTVAIQQNGVAVTGLTAVSVTTTATTTNASSPPSVSNGDYFAPVVSSISGTPDGMTITFYFDVTV